jgi:hypothetical protein
MRLARQDRRRSSVFVAFHCPDLSSQIILLQIAESQQSAAHAAPCNHTSVNFGVPGRLSLRFCTRGL